MPNSVEVRLPAEAPGPAQLGTMARALQTALGLSVGGAPVPLMARRQDFDGDTARAINARSLSGIEARNRVNALERVLVTAVHDVSRRNVHFRTALELSAARSSMARLLGYTSVNHPSALADARDRGDDAALIALENEIRPLVQAADLQIAAAQYTEGLLSDFLATTIRYADFWRTNEAGRKTLPGPVRTELERQERVVHGMLEELTRIAPMVSQIAQVRLFDTMLDEDAIAEALVGLPANQTIAAAIAANPTRPALRRIPVGLHSQTVATLRDGQLLYVTALAGLPATLTIAAAITANPTRTALREIPPSLHTQTVAQVRLIRGDAIYRTITEQVGDQAADLGANPAARRAAISAHITRLRGQIVAASTQLRDQLPAAQTWETEAREQVQLLQLAANALPPMTQDTSVTPPAMRATVSFKLRDLRTKYPGNIPLQALIRVLDRVAPNGNRALLDETLFTVFSDMEALRVLRLGVDPTRPLAQTLGLPERVNGTAVTGMTLTALRAALPGNVALAKFCTSLRPEVMVKTLTAVQADHADIIRRFELGHYNDQAEKRMRDVFRIGDPWTREDGTAGAERSRMANKMLIDSMVARSDQVFEEMFKSGNISRLPALIDQYKDIIRLEMEYHRQELSMATQFTSLLATGRHIGPDTRPQGMPPTWGLDLRQREMLRNGSLPPELRGQLEAEWEQYGTGLEQYIRAIEIARARHDTAARRIRENIVRHIDHITQLLSRILRVVNRVAWIVPDYTLWAGHGVRWIIRNTAGPGWVVNPGALETELERLNGEFRTIGEIADRFETVSVGPRANITADIAMLRDLRRAAPPQELALVGGSEPPNLEQFFLAPASRPAWMPEALLKRYNDARAAAAAEPANQLLLQQLRQIQMEVFTLYVSDPARLRLFVTATCARYQAAKKALEDAQRGGNAGEIRRAREELRLAGLDAITAYGAVTNRLNTRDVPDLHNGVAGLMNELGDKVGFHAGRFQEYDSMEAMAWSIGIGAVTTLVEVQILSQLAMRSGIWGLRHVGRAAWWTSTRPFVWTYRGGRALVNRWAGPPVGVATGPVGPGVPRATSRANLLANMEALRAARAEAMGLPPGLARNARIAQLELEVAQWQARMETHVAAHGAEEYSHVAARALGVDHSLMSAQRMRLIEVAHQFGGALEASERFSVGVLRVKNSILQTGRVPLGPFSPEVQRELDRLGLRAGQEIRMPGTATTGPGNGPAIAATERLEATQARSLMETGVTGRRTATAAAEVGADAAHAGLALNPARLEQLSKIFARQPTLLRFLQNPAQVLTMSMEEMIAFDRQLAREMQALTPHQARVARARFTDAIRANPALERTLGRQVRALNSSLRMHNLATAGLVAAEIAGLALQIYMLLEALKARHEALARADHDKRAMRRQLHDAGFRPAGYSYSDESVWMACDQWEHEQLGMRLNLRSMDEAFRSQADMYGEQAIAHGIMAGANLGVAILSMTVASTGVGIVLAVGLIVVEVTIMKWIDNRHHDRLVENFSRLPYFLIEIIARTSQSTQLNETFFRRLALDGGSQEAMAMRMGCMRWLQDLPPELHSEIMMGRSRLDEREAFFQDDFKDHIWPAFKDALFMRRFGRAPTPSAADREAMANLFIRYVNDRWVLLDSIERSDRVLPIHIRQAATDAAVACLPAIRARRCWEMRRRLLVEGDREIEWNGGVLMLSTVVNQLATGMAPENGTPRSLTYVRQDTEVVSGGARGNPRTRIVNTTVTYTRPSLRLNRTVQDVTSEWTGGRRALGFLRAKLGDANVSETGAIVRATIANTLVDFRRTNGRWELRRTDTEAWTALRGFTVAAAHVLDSAEAAAQINNEIAPVLVALEASDVDSESTLVARNGQLLRFKFDRGDWLMKLGDRWAPVTETVTAAHVGGSAPAAAAFNTDVLPRLRGLRSPTSVRTRMVAVLTAAPFSGSDDAGTVTVTRRGRTMRFRTEGVTVQFESRGTWKSADEFVLPADLGGPSYGPAAEDFNSNVLPTLRRLDLLAGETIIGGAQSLQGFALTAPPTGPNAYPPFARNLMDTVVATPSEIYGAIADPVQRAQLLELHRGNPGSIDFVHTSANQDAVINTLGHGVHGIPNPMMGLSPLDHSRVWQNRIGVFRDSGQGLATRRITTLASELFDTASAARDVTEDAAMRQVVFPDQANSPLVLSALSQRQEPRPAGRPAFAAIHGFGRLLTQNTLTPGNLPGAFAGTGVHADIRTAFAPGNLRAVIFRGSPLTEGDRRESRLNPNQMEDMYVLHATFVFHDGDRQYLIRRSMVCRPSGNSWNPVYGAPIVQRADQYHTRLERDDLELANRRLRQGITTQAMERFDSNDGEPGNDRRTFAPYTGEALESVYGPSRLRAPLFLSGVAPQAFTEGSPQFLLAQRLVRHRFTNPVGETVAPGAFFLEFRESLVNGRRTVTALLTTAHGGMTRMNAGTRVHRHAASIEIIPDTTQPGGTRLGRIQDGDAVGFPSGGTGFLRLGGVPSIVRSFATQIDPDGMRSLNIAVGDETRRQVSDMVEDVEEDLAVAHQLGHVDRLPDGSVQGAGQPGVQVHRGPDGSTLVRDGGLELGARPFRMYLRYETPTAVHMTPVTHRGRMFDFPQVPSPDDLGDMDRILRDARTSAGRRWGVTDTSRITITYLSLTAANAPTEVAVLPRFGDARLHRIGSASELHALPFPAREDVLKALCTPILTNRDGRTWAVDAVPTLERILRFFPAEVSEGSQTFALTLARNMQLRRMLTDAPDKEVFLRRFFEVLRREGSVRRDNIERIVASRELVEASNSLLLSREQPVARRIVLAGGNTLEVRTEGGIMAFRVVRRIVGFDGEPRFTAGAVELWQEDVRVQGTEERGEREDDIPWTEFRPEDLQSADSVLTVRGGPASPGGDRPVLLDDLRIALVDRLQTDPLARVAASRDTAVPTGLHETAWTHSNGDVVTLRALPPRATARRVPMTGTADVGGPVYDWGSTLMLRRYSGTEEQSYVHFSNLGTVRAIASIGVMDTQIRGLVGPAYEDFREKWSDVLAVLREAGVADDRPVRLTEVQAERAMELLKEAIRLCPTNPIRARLQRLHDDIEMQSAWGQIHETLTTPVATPEPGTPEFSRGVLESRIVTILNLFAYRQRPGDSALSSRAEFTREVASLYLLQRTPLQQRLFLARLLRELERGAQAVPGERGGALIIDGAALDRVKGTMHLMYSHEVHHNGYNVVHGGQIVHFRSRAGQLEFSTGADWKSVTEDVLAADVGGSAAVATHFNDNVLPQLRRIQETAESGDVNALLLAEEQATHYLVNVQRATDTGFSVPHAGGALRVRNHLGFWEFQSAAGTWKNVREHRVTAADCGGNAEAAERLNSVVLPDLIGPGGIAAGNLARAEGTRHVVSLPGSASGGYEVPLAGGDPGRFRWSGATWQFHSATGWKNVTGNSFTAADCGSDERARLLNTYYVESLRTATTEAAGLRSLGHEVVSGGQEITHSGKTLRVRFSPATTSWQFLSATGWKTVTGNTVTAADVGGDAATATHFNENVLPGLRVADGASQAPYRIRGRRALLGLVRPTYAVTESDGMISVVYAGKTVQFRSGARGWEYHVVMPTDGPLDTGWHPVSRAIPAADVGGSEAIASHVNENILTILHPWALQMPSVTAEYEWRTGFDRSRFEFGRIRSASRLPYFQTVVTEAPPDETEGDGVPTLGSEPVSRPETHLVRFLDDRREFLLVPPSVRPEPPPVALQSVAFSVERFRADTNRVADITWRGLPTTVEGAEVLTYTVGYTARGIPAAHMEARLRDALPDANALDFDRNITTGAVTVRRLSPAQVARSLRALSGDPEGTEHAVAGVRGPDAAFRFGVRGEGESPVEWLSIRRLSDLWDVSIPERTRSLARRVLITPLAHTAPNEGHRGSLQRILSLLDERSTEHTDRWEMADAERMTLDALQPLYVAAVDKGAFLTAFLDALQGVNGRLTVSGAERVIRTMRMRVRNEEFVPTLNPAGFTRIPLGIHMLETEANSENMLIRLVSPTGTPAARFTYYDENGAYINAGAEGRLARADWSRIRSVSINLGSSGPLVVDRMPIRIGGATLAAREDARALSLRTQAQEAVTALAAAAQASTPDMGALQRMAADLNALLPIVRPASGAALSTPAGLSAFVNAQRFADGRVAIAGNRGVIVSEVVDGVPRLRVIVADTLRSELSRAYASLLSFPGDRVALLESIRLFNTQTAVLRAIGGTQALAAADAARPMLAPGHRGYMLLADITTQTVTLDYAPFGDRAPRERPAMPEALDLAPVTLAVGTTMTVTRRRENEADQIATITVETVDGSAARLVVNPATAAEDVGLEISDTAPTGTEDPASARTVRVRVTRDPAECLVRIGTQEVPLVTADDTTGLQDAESAENRNTHWVRIEGKSEWYFCREVGPVGARGRAFYRLTAAGRQRLSPSGHTWEAIPAGEDPNLPNIDRVDEALTKHVANYNALARRRADAVLRQLSLSTDSFELAFTPRTPDTIATLTPFLSTASDAVPTVRGETLVVRVNGAGIAATLSHANLVRAE